MDLQDSDNAGVHVVRLRGLGVVYVDGEPSAWNPEDRGVVEKLWELLGVESSAWDEQLEVGPESGDVLDEAEKDVCVQGSLVSLEILILF